MGFRETRLALLILAAVCLVVPLASAFENLVQAQGEVRKDRPAKPLSFASPDWNIYHRTINLHRLIANFSKNCPSAHLTPKIAVPGESLSAGGALRPDRHVDPDLDDPQLPLGLSSAADGLLYLIIRPKTSNSDNSPARRFADGILRRTRPQQTTRIMFVFGEEGRDLLTPEIALRVLRNACSQPATTSTNDDRHFHSQPRLKEGVELILVPVLNADGRRISEMGRRCDRTNANDVDIDRNWPSFWGEPDTIPADVQPKTASTRKRAGFLRAAVARHAMARGESFRYHSSSPGSHPFSEPETRSLRAIVEKIRPASYVSVRTGAVAVTVPWDCKPNLLAHTQRARLLRVSEMITAGHCTRCKTGNLWNVTGHVKCGTGTDYIYGNLRVPFVHTWHVYDMPTIRGDCFKRHNPVSKVAYDRVTENWGNAVFNFSNSVFNWITLEDSEGVDAAERNASLSAAKAGEEREKALARGEADPEDTEEDSSVSRETTSRLDRRQDATEQGNKERRKRLADSFLLFKDPQNPQLTDVSASEGKVGPQFREKSMAATDRNESGLLTGWWGVWTAFLLMGVSFYVAKRYVFRKRPGRSRFLSHPDVKHA